MSFLGAPPNSQRGSLDRAQGVFGDCGTQKGSPAGDPKSAFTLRGRGLQTDRKKRNDDATEEKEKKQKNNNNLKLEACLGFFGPFYLIKRNTISYFIQVIFKTMRSRSGSITPTYSTDRDLLKSLYPNTASVKTTQEAKEAMSKLTIFEHSTFKKRVPLDTIEECSSFMESCRDEIHGEYVLDNLLKKCYTVAFSMPPSPKSSVRHVRKASSTSIENSSSPPPTPEKSVPPLTV